MTSSPGWLAPVAAGPLRATVRLPGSKSLTNRWLVLAALGERPVLLRGALRSRDTALMTAALQALGVEIAHDGPDLTITPGPLRGGGRVDCGLAGTVLRFIPPLASLAAGSTQLDGDPRSRQRPLVELIRALRALGAKVDGDALPITVRGQGHLRGGATRIDGSASSQLISALLLSAPRYDEGLELTHVGSTLPSLPHIDMTVSCLRAAGVTVEQPAPDQWVVTPGSLQLQTTVVEPDLSNAGPFLAAALVAGGSVTVPDWPSQTAQAGDRLRDLLTTMGAEVRLTAEGLRVEGTGAVSGLEADLRDVGELVPTVVALAALAETPSRITGVAHLRGHETDRLAALVTELRRLGGDAEELPDGLVVRPRPLHGGLFRSYADHRMATAGAIIGLRVPGVQVEDVATTGKTLPGFTELWDAMLTQDSA